jgi:hypothetical protein
LGHPVPRGEKKQQKMAHEKGASPLETRLILCDVSFGN